MPERLVSIQEVMQQLGIRSRTTWAKVRRAPDFPEPITLPGFSRPRWRQFDIDRWIERRSPAQARRGST